MDSLAGTQESSWHQQSDSYPLTQSRHGDDRKLRQRRPSESGLCDPSMAGTRSTGARSHERMAVDAVTAQATDCAGDFPLFAFPEEPPQQVINDTKQLQLLISRPRMADEYLRKPPFKFLHTIVIEVMKETGFGKDLFTIEEQDASNLLAKSEKIEFLHKIFNATSSALDEEIEVEPCKVLAGLEAVGTNLWLQQLHKAALQYQGDGAIELPVNLMSGELVSVMSVGPRWTFAKLKKHLDKIVAQTDPDSQVLRLMCGARVLQGDATVADAGLANGDSLHAVLGTPGDLDEIILGTQESIGSLIRKPKMVEKYLRRPPFRFLFDIVMEVMRVTGFAEDLFLPSERDPHNLTIAAVKVAWVRKIIDRTAEALGEEVDVSPSKIVAGMEPHKTNMWLQQLHRAALQDGEVH